MSPHPAISIVIPLYNKASTIQKPYLPASPKPSQIFSSSLLMETQQTAVLKSLQKSTTRELSFSNRKEKASPLQGTRGLHAHLETMSHFLMRMTHGNQPSWKRFSNLHKSIRKLECMEQHLQSAKITILCV